MYNRQTNYWEIFIQIPPLEAGIMHVGGATHKLYQAVLSFKHPKQIILSVISVLNTLFIVFQVTIITIEELALATLTLICDMKTMII